MSKVAKLHREAMDLAEAAVAASVRGDGARAFDLFAQAFHKEAMAARLYAEDEGLEPTRSVLFRSAASLAIDCGENREAERLIAHALAGDPPPEIADELRDLLEQVHFGRHLEIRGVELAPEDFQLAIAGQGIGFGFAPTDAVVTRVNLAERLLVRTAERKAGRPFRETGAPPKRFSESVELYLSVPRAASFAVTFRVGQPKDQIDLPGLAGAVELVDDLIECLALYEESEEALRSRIPDEAYFNNFKAIASQIGPNGSDVSFVGITTSRGGAQRTVSLTRTTHRALSRPANIPLARTMAVTGRLLFADERRGANIIRLVDDNDFIEHRIAVPPGMMSDIVKPLWEDRVTVFGKRKRKTIYLEDIRKADDGPAEREVAD